MIDNPNRSIEEQHKFCPKGEDSWYKVWSDRENYKPNNRLPLVFLAELKPMFKSLLNDSLLSRCLLGLTQNQNEALNGVLWSKCPKTKFAGHCKVELAVCDAVNCFNTGAGSKLDLLQMCWVSPGENLIHAAEMEDTSWIKFAEIKISEAARVRRQKKRQEKSKKEEKKVATYFPGAFGVTKEPDFEIDGPSKPKKTKKTKISESETNVSKVVPAACDPINQADKGEIKFIDEASITVIYFKSSWWTVTN